MKKNSATFLLIACLLCMAERSFSTETTESTTLPATETPAQKNNKASSHDPRINPDFPFKNTYRSTGPLHIYFSYFYLQTAYSPKLNQLTVVTKDTLTLHNVLGGVELALGHVSSNLGAQGALAGYPLGPWRSDLFATRDALVGSQIEDISNRAKLENPALNDIPKLLDQKAIDYVKNKPSAQNRKYFENLFVRPSQWSLVFQQSADQPDTMFYVLKFQAWFSKFREGDKDTLFHKSEERGEYCSFSSEPKTLEQWKVDDYAALLAMRADILETCAKRIDEALPRIFEEGEALNVPSPEYLVQRAKIMCKTQQSQCIKIAKMNETAAPDVILECKDEYADCREEELKPLIDATPIGQCKLAMNACKTHITEELQSTSPGAKPTRLMFNRCADEYKVCVKASKNGKASEDTKDADDIDARE